MHIYLKNQFMNKKSRNLKKIEEGRKGSGKQCNYSLTNNVTINVS